MQIATPLPRFTTHGRLRRAWTAAGAWLLLGVFARAVIGAAGYPKLGPLILRAWCAAASTFLRIDYDIEGLEFVDKSRSYLVAPLHEGFVDVLAVARLGLSTRYVALEELREWPVLGAYLERSDAVLLRPDQPRTAYRRILTAARKAADVGESLVVFPQGTILGIETGFHEGVFAVARRLGLPVLPVVITGTHRVWDHPFDNRIRYGRRVSVRVLPAIDPGDLDSARLQRIMKQIAQAPGLAPARRFDPGRDGWWDDYSYTIDPAFAYLAAREARERHASQGPAHDDVGADLG